MFVLQDGVTGPGGYIGDGVTVTPIQHLTFDECYAYAPLSIANPPWIQAGFPSVLWANFWMVHFWVFDPNPLGLYAGWHPTLNLDAAGEGVINARVLDPLDLNRPISHFFSTHHGIADACCRQVGVDANSCCQTLDWRNDLLCRCDEAPLHECSDGHQG